MIGHDYYDDIYDKYSSTVVENWMTLTGHLHDHDDW